ncbi:MAG: dUTP diphosphatase [Candidatus Saccharibacteria bacterium]|nr:dUTP diphosphatase [Candidatus Saccharibacteria bacterium]
MRDFEKISFEQFKKDVADDRALYDSFTLPMRTTKKAAGYDFVLLHDLTINPGEIVKLPTGVKSFFAPDEMLLIIVRSSTGFKYNIRLVNQVGVIDSDYYNNPDNEGHIFIKIQNEGDKAVSFKAGDAVAQGIFVKYLATDTERTIDASRGSKY